MNSHAPIPLSRTVRPVEPMLDLYRELNRWFEDMMSFTPMSTMASTAWSMSPRLEVRETDDALCLTAELPGVQARDLDVQLEGDMLTLAGEKKAGSQDASSPTASVHVAERSYGRFQRTLQLPFVPDADEVQAHFDQGVLTLRLPKRPASEGSRRIDIQTGPAPAAAPDEGGSAPAFPDENENAAGTPPSQTH